VAAAAVARQARAQRVGVGARPPRVWRARCTAGASRTERILRELDRRDADAAGGGAGASTTWAALQRAEAAWRTLREEGARRPQQPPPRLVTDLSHQPLAAATDGARPDGGRGGGGGGDADEDDAAARAAASSAGTQFDVVVCGGTLGVFAALALVRRGLAGARVAVVERARVAGREQEWNISRKEMRELVHEGVLEEGDLSDPSVVCAEFFPSRIGFNSGGGEGVAGEVLTREVLNLGVSPRELVSRVKRRFLEAGGVVLEGTSVAAVEVHSDGVLLRTAPTQQQQQASSTGGDGVLTCQLLLDCMGHSSPIARQVRGGAPPDAVCCVVGTCASGYTSNEGGDVIYTTSDIARCAAGSDVQYFWEAFPAGVGPTHRTTYMFSYMEPHPARPSLEQMLEDYWRLLPAYQHLDEERGVDQLRVERVMFGLFPSWKASPLQPGFDRVLQIGDASGIQSPLSFGGFGALTRHLPRVSGAVVEALQVGALAREDLALINAYNPGLSASWLFQEAMFVRVGTRCDASFINRLMGATFQVMEELGPPTMMPFLQVRTGGGGGGGSRRPRRGRG